MQEINIFPCQYDELFFMYINLKKIKTKQLHTSLETSLLKTRDFLGLPKRLLTLF